MTHIAIAYHSGSGHTLELVQVVADQLTNQGATVTQINVEALSAASWASLDKAQAIIFATPTYMGSASAPFKAFMDASSDIWGGDQGWNDKIAAGITVATFPGGDKLATLMQLVVFAAQHGMIWVGLDEIGAPVNPDRPGINQDGYCLGLAATSVRGQENLVREGDITTARRFADRLLRVTKRFEVEGQDV